MGKIKPLMIPTIPVYIISNRPLYLRPVTNKWLRKNKIETISTHLRPVHQAFPETGRIKYKASIINDLQLDIYFEDELEIIKKLKKLCPETKILYPESAIILSKAKAT